MNRRHSGGEPQGDVGGSEFNPQVTEHDDINRLITRSGHSYPTLPQNNPPPPIPPKVPASIPEYEAPNPPLDSHRVNASHPYGNTPVVLGAPPPIPPLDPLKMAEPTQTSLVGSHNIYNNAPSGNTPAYASPIRVIPTHISIRQFSGSDLDFSARQFLDLCESVIVNSSITEDHDKIAFIRSRLMPGSRALLLMQSSAFSAADIGTNYEVFKKNFIKIFFGRK